MKTGVRARADMLAGALPPLLVAAERIAQTVAHGVHGRRRAGAGDSFWQFRPYAGGDAASAIDWRQTARSDRAFVREREWEAAQSVYLWADGSASMAWRSAGHLPHKGERADLLLLALASLLLRGGERVALLGGDRPSSGRTVLDRLARTLDARSPAMTASLPPPIALPRAATLVLIGDFLGDPAELDPSIRGIAAHGVAGHLVQILDPAEESLPFDGRVRFEGSRARVAS